MGTSWLDQFPSASFSSICSSTLSKAYAKASLASEGVSCSDKTVMTEKINSASLKSFIFSNAFITPDILNLEKSSSSLNRELECSGHHGFETVFTFNCA